MIGIGAIEVLLTVSPADAELTEDVDLAAVDGGLDRRSGDIAHRTRWRTLGGHGSARGVDKCCAGWEKH